MLWNLWRDLMEVGLGGHSQVRTAYILLARSEYIKTSNYKPLQPKSNKVLYDLNASQSPHKPYKLESRPMFNRSQLMSRVLHRCKGNAYIVHAQSSRLSSWGLVCPSADKPLYDATFKDFFTSEDLYEGFRFILC